MYLFIYSSIYEPRRGVSLTICIPFYFGDIASSNHGILFSPKLKLSFWFSYFYIFFCLFTSLYSLTQTFISASCMFSFVLPNLSETAFHLFQIALTLLHDFGRTPLKLQFRSGIRPEPLLNLKISTKLKTSSSQLWSLWNLNDRMHYWEYICPCQFLLDKKKPRWVIFCIS